MDRVARGLTLTAERGWASEDIPVRLELQLYGVIVPFNFEFRK
jgi:hypothetical protein